MGRVMRRVLWLLLLAGCAGGEGPSLDQVDCSVCSADQVCWYDYDLDADEYRGHCAAWPSYCDADRSCECIDTQRGPGGEAFCDDFGVQNSDVCEVHDGRPLVRCETNLG